MKKVSLVILASLSALTSVAYAQVDGTGVVSSTDPQRIAEIQQHAQQVQAQDEHAGRYVDDRRYYVKHRVRHHHKKAAAAPQQ